MKTWAYVAGAAAAVSAAVLVTLAIRRSGKTGGEQIPGIIADCQDRVDRLERELHRLRTSTAS